MKVTLRQLLVFKTIYAEGQISRAAKMLHLSVPAASLALKELESTLNCRLFERTGNGLVLNDKGELLLPYANDILGKEQQLERVFHDAVTGIGGMLTVGANKTAGNYVLSRMLPHFHQRYPNTQIRLVIKDSGSIERMVSERELDLAFIDTKPSLPNLSCEPWVRDKICIVCSSSNPIVKETITAELLSQQVWYLDEGSTVARVKAIQLLHHIGVVPSQEITMSTLGAIKRATATGYGVSILPYMSIDAELSRGDLVELSLPNWNFDRGYWIIQRSEEVLASLPRNFLEFATTAENWPTQSQR